MYFDFILDKFVSNFIVYVAYTLIIFLWSYFFYNFGHDINFLLFYFPYGIIILAFLFFGNKVLLGMSLSNISLYFMLKNYNLDLPFNNFFAISACQLVCVPLTLIVLQKFNFSVGACQKCSLDKTNIYHVLFITFSSTTVLGTLLTFSSLLFYNDTKIAIFTIAHFVGASTLIVLLKILVNIPKVLRS